jgi:hypothetical protein
LRHGNPEENRRKFARKVTMGVGGAALSMIGRNISSAQAVNTRRSLADKLYVSKYLPEAYAQASSALLEFDTLTASGKPAAALDSLRRAAGIICDALARLENDAQLWATLGEQRGAIGKNSAEIKRLLSNLEQFIPEEEKVLHGYLPAGPQTRLTSSLSLALSRYRDEPTSWTLENLRSRVSDTHDAVCAASKAASEPRSDFFSNLRIVGYSLGVLGGAATIVINSITTMAVPAALTSVVGGVATIIGSSNGVATEMRSRKR